MLRVAGHAIVCDPWNMPLDIVESARRFRERALAARAEREHNAAQIRAHVDAVLQQLLPPNGHAWLIGSLAWGGFGERSDVDLVVEQVNSVLASQIEDAIARRAGVEVDLLHLNELPQSFRERIEREGVLIRGVDNLFRHLEAVRSVLAKS